MMTTEEKNRQLETEEKINIEKRKLEEKLIKKKKEMRIKRSVSKIFVFDDSWQRRKFDCKQLPDLRIEEFYQKDTFVNQRQFGTQIHQAFDDMNVTHVLAVAPTQSGKTGTMLALIREFNKSDSTQRVDYDHIFIFTSHSSIEWTEQTKKRFPMSMRHRIYHRNQLKQFIDDVTNLDNILIIFDESHIANMYGQTLFSLYNKLGFFNIKRLYSKNIKIVHFTATPHNIILNTHRWQNSLKVIHMQVPENYISYEHYLHNKQIFECKPLLGQIDNIREILDFIDIHNPYYHIIRTPRGHKHHELLNDFKFAFERFNFEFISEPLYRKQGRNFYNLLSHKPNVHTFIFIIDKLRCAKSIQIQHIQIFYERFVLQPKIETVLQSILGRCTGYHTFNSHIRIFTFKHFIQYHNFTTHNFKTIHNLFSP